MTLLVPGKDDGNVPVGGACSDDEDLGMRTLHERNDPKTRRQGKTVPKIVPKIRRNEQHYSPSC